MYIRFVVPERHRLTRVESGIFRTIDHVITDKRQPDWLRKTLQAELDWFNTNLPVPNRLWIDFKRRRTIYGVCWFRPFAKEAISHARQIQWLMLEAGYLVEEIHTDRPDTILYKDTWQIVAKSGDHVPRGFH